MAKIKERMRDIQQVLNDFEHIVVERDILASTRDAADNNLSVELLEKYATAVLPIIGGKAAAAPEIRSVPIEARRKAIDVRRARA